MNCCKGNIRSTQSSKSSQLYKPNIGGSNCFDFIPCACACKPKIYKIESLEAKTRYGLRNWFAEHCVFSLLATKLHRVFKKCTVTIPVTRNMYEAVDSSTEDKQRLFLA